MADFVLSAPRKMAGIALRALPGCRTRGPFLLAGLENGASIRDGRS
jgi:hypothetical protein